MDTRQYAPHRPAGRFDSRNIESHNLPALFTKTVRYLSPARGVRNKVQADELRGFPEIVALHTTNGGWDLVAEIEVNALAEFDRVLGRLRRVPGVVNSETSLLLSSVLR